MRWAALRTWTNAVYTALSEAAAGWLASSHISKQLRLKKLPLHWSNATVANLRHQLQSMITSESQEPPASTVAYTTEAHMRNISAQEIQLIAHIQETTTAHNRSNVTRTSAYLEMYEAYPELHWAFLAHMVSRNGGWNMSDLKGGLMSDLMDPAFKEQLYQFLERCNALIFQDAYPQLLLYKHSLERGTPLFHLLPEFHVSRFMSPFWEQFWEDRVSPLLTVALIINEQNYIECRVAQHPFYRKHVLNHPSFRLHEHARLNQIVFPLHHQDIPSVPGQWRIRSLPSRPLIGLRMPRFNNLKIRINTGKALYAMLFGYEEPFEQTLAYARSTPHHGSRAEYWPELFTYARDAAMTTANANLELTGSEWLRSGNRLFSPLIEDVWHDSEYESISEQDWFQNERMLSYLSAPKRPFQIDMTHAHRTALEEIAIVHDLERQLPIG